MRFPAHRLVLLLSLLSGLDARAGVVLYDGSQNTTPDAQGWFYLRDPFVGSQASQSASGGLTTLSTTALNGIQAGYFTRNPLTGAVHPAMPVLDRTTGYTIEFDVRINSESHARNDRAGFSLIALSSDHRGLELGFWSDEIWAQADDPLFTHAESAAYDTTAGVVRYRLSVQGNAYNLYAGSGLLLSGELRDYSAFGAPYTYQNFLFLGDNTTSASASTSLGRVAVLSGVVPEPSGLALGLIGAGAGLMWLRTRRARRDGGRSAA